MDLYWASWIENPGVRATGLIAMALFVLAMLLKSERQVKIGLAFGNLFAIYHLWALGSTVAALLSLAAFVRLGLAAYSNPKSSTGRLLAIIFSVFYLATAVVFYKAPIDLLALVGTMVNTWAVFLLTGVRFRAALAFGMTIWVAFDFSVGAVEMAVASTLSALAAFYAWGREVKESRLMRPDSQNKSLSNNFKPTCAGSQETTKP